MAGTNVGNVLLAISTTHRPATDVGFPPHKHSDRVQSFDVSTGTAHVFYPEAIEACCMLALESESLDPWL